MRFAFFLLLILAAVPAQALGRLVQPDGSVVALGEASSDGARTLLFPAQAVPSRSFLLLPEGSVATDIEVGARGVRRVVAFPSLSVPELRYALEVPAQTLSLTLRGQFSGDLTLVRSVVPPSDGQLWVVRTPTELRIDLPTWTTAAGWTPYLHLSRPVPSPWTLTVSSEQGTRTFEFGPSVVQWDYPPAAWGAPPRRLTLRAADPRLSWLRLGAVPAHAPLPADPATLLAWPEERWRNPRREWFHWAGTSVVVLVTANYRVQDDYLKRLAFFVEKAGYRGRIVDPEEVAALHAWNAHDYAAPDLARFYNLADQEGIALNPSEQELLNTLASAGVLTGGSGSWKPGTGALVGISVESAPALRSVLFVHEAFHGLYFTTPEFRSGVKEAWDGLSEASREAFRRFLSQSRYDATDEGLMINEFQAYVLQRPAAGWEAFFRDRVLAGEPATAAKLNALVEYLAAAGQLDALVKRLFGFPSGDVSPVRVSSGT